MSQIHPIKALASVEDGAWVADVPASFYCPALGDTSRDAVAEGAVAIVARLEVAKSSGKPLAKPSIRMANA
jgi:predicted RNase H-like HicB family nuclease